LKVVPAGSNVIASHGVESEANFQIKACSQAFRILSSGLYSDKISAVLREIGCNAADSHVAAGIPDRPIEVKLPTALDSSFYIKDWGTGLTHEEVTGLFTTYFSSNKSESNDFTGAFGLGSKSPFSYTDSFMVTVAKDGLKRFYTAHIGKDGSPVITMLGKGEPTTEDWPSGMMVSFPVKPSDAAEFRRKAHAVYRWFRVKPVLLGAEAVKEPVFKIVGSNFRLGPEGSQDAMARVIMGNVAYPLNWTRLGTDDRVVQSLVDANVVVEVPIGSVMPTASREELEYDPITREHLISILRRAAKEIAEQLLEMSRTKGLTSWNRTSQIRRYVKNLPPQIYAHLDKYIALLDVSAEEKEVLSKLTYAEACEVPTWAGAYASLSLIAKGNGKSDAAPRLRIHLYRDGEREGTVSRREVIAGHITRGSSTEPARVLYQDNVKVVIGDAPHTHERIKVYVADQPDRTVVLSVTGATKDQMSHAEAYARKLAEAMGGIDVIKASELPVPENVDLKKAKAKGERVRPEKLHAKEMVTYWDLTKGVGTASVIKLSEVPADGQYYVPENTRKGTYETSVGGGTRSLNRYETNHLLKSYLELRALGVSLPKIDGVVVATPGKIKQLQLAEGGWKNLFSTILEALESKPVRKELKALVNPIPRLELNQYWERGSDALPMVLAREAHKNTAVWKAIEPVLKEHPQVRVLIQEILCATIPKNRKSLARAAVDTLVYHWPTAQKAVEHLKLLSAGDLGHMLKEQYPLLAFLDAHTFREAANKSPEQAAQCLKALLWMKSAATQADEVKPVTVQDAQLPLALAS